MYGKIFNSIFDSTLVADGGFLPTYIFMSMVSMANKHGVVDIADRALYHRLGFQNNESLHTVSYEDFQTALEFLQREDKSSKNPSHNGKRIISLRNLAVIPSNRGYWLVNYQHYVKMLSKEEKRIADRDRKREERGSKKAKEISDVATCPDLSQNVADVAHIDIDIDKDSNTNNQSSNNKQSRSRRFTPPSVQEVQDYINTMSYNVDAQKFVDYYESVGWMRGKNKIKSWKACVRTWDSRNKDSSQPQDTLQFI